MDEDFEDYSDSGDEGFDYGDEEEEVDYQSAWADWERTGGRELTKADFATMTPKEKAELKFKRLIKDRFEKESVREKLFSQASSLPDFMVMNPTLLIDSLVYMEKYGMKLSKKTLTEYKSTSNKADIVRYIRYIQLNSE